MGGEGYATEKWLSLDSLATLCGVHEPNLARAKQLIDAVRRLRVASRNSQNALRLKWPHLIPTRLQWKRQMVRGLALSRTRTLHRLISAGTRWRPGHQAPSPSPLNPSHPKPPRCAPVVELHGERMECTVTQKPQARSFSQLPLALIWRSGRGNVPDRSGTGEQTPEGKHISLSI